MSKKTNNADYGLLNTLFVLFVIGSGISFLIVVLVTDTVLLNGQNFHCEGKSHLSLLDETQGVFYCEEDAVSVFFKYEGASSDLIPESNTNTGIGIILDEEGNLIQRYEINYLGILKTHWIKEQ